VLSVVQLLMLNTQLFNDDYDVFLLSACVICGLYS